MAWSSEVDRKSTRLNSSHPSISYAVFCLKKKKQPLEVGNATHGVAGAGRTGGHAAEIEPRRTHPFGPDDEIPEERVHDPHALQIAGTCGRAGKIAHALPVPPSPREAEQGVRPL